MSYFFIQAVELQSVFYARVDYLSPLLQTTPFLIPIWSFFQTVPLNLILYFCSVIPPFLRKFPKKASIH